MGLSPTQVQVGSRFILVDLNIYMCPTRWTQTQVKMSRTETKGVRLLSYNAMYVSLIILL